MFHWRDPQPILIVSTSPTPFFFSNQIGARKGLFLEGKKNGGESLRLGNRGVRPSGSWVSFLDSLPVALKGHFDIADLSTLLNENPVDLGMAFHHQITKSID